MIDLAPTPEEQSLANVLTAFLARELPVSRLRPGAKAIDPSVTRAAVAELGIIGLAIPEAAGGAGCELRQEVIAHRELGRHLASPTILAAATAAKACLEAGRVGLATQIARGDHEIGLLVPEPSLGAPETCYLIEDDQADYALFCGDQGAALYDASELTRLGEVRGIHSRLPLSRVSVSAAEPVASVGGTSLPRQIALLCAASLVGASEGATTLATEYAKVREQFGKPIGAFQAIKHKCTDMLVRSSLAWAQTVAAASTTPDGSGGLDVDAHAALLLATEAAIENAANTIQVHGGIGFTDECDAHHYLKQAHLVATLCGGARKHRHMLVQPGAPVVGK